MTLPRPAPPGGDTARRTAGNALVAALSQVVGKFATLAWTLVAARVLPADEFGALFFLLAAALLVSAVAEWGFDPVLTRRASRDPSQTSALFTQALAWQLGIAVPLFAVTGLVVTTSTSVPGAGLATVLVLVSVLLEMASDTCRAASAAKQRQGGTSAALVLHRGVTAVLVVVALVVAPSAASVAGALVGGALVGMLASLRALRRLDVHLRRAAVRPSAMREMARGTATVGVSALVLMALFRLDTVLLGVLRGAEDVAAYTAAYRLFEAVLFVAFGLRSAVFPVMSAAETPAKVGEAMRAGVAAAAVLYLPFAAIVLVDAPALLELLFGEQYAESSSTALRWLALAPIAFTVAFVGNGALQATDRAIGMLVSSVVTTVVNVVANLVLLPRYGASAAAATTTCSYALQAALTLAWLRRGGVHTSPSRAVAEPAAASLLLAGLLVVLPLPVLVEVALGGALYLALWASIVRRTDPQQLALVKGLVRRRRR